MHPEGFAAKFPGDDVNPNDAVARRIIQDFDRQYISPDADAVIQATRSTLVSAVIGAVYVLVAAGVGYGMRIDSVAVWGISAVIGVGLAVRILIWTHKEFEDGE